MTKSEEMKRFEADMASDKELGKKLYEVVDRIAAENKVQSDGELFAKAAEELGYRITAADFERLDAEREEISPEDLAQAAGGGNSPEWCWRNYGCSFGYEAFWQDEYNHTAVCLTAWHCFATTLHTETNSEDVACWKNYMCLVVNKPIDT